MEEHVIIKILDEMIEDMIKHGIPLGFSKRYFEVGEWGLCFEEINVEAQKNLSFESRWKRKFLQLRQLLLERGTR